MTWLCPDCRLRRDSAHPRTPPRAADEHLVAGLTKALERLESMLDGENQQVAFRAVREYMDRALGRASQPHQLEAAVAPEPMIITPEIDAGKVLAGLSELGLIRLRGDDRPFPANDEG